MRHISHAILSTNITPSPKKNLPRLTRRTVIPPSKTPKTESKTEPEDQEKSLIFHLPETFNNHSQQQQQPAPSQQEDHLPDTN